MFNLVSMLRQAPKRSEEEIPLVPLPGLRTQTGFLPLDSYVPAAAEASRAQPEQDLPDINIPASLNWFSWQGIQAFFENKKVRDILALASISLLQQVPALAASWGLVSLGVPILYVLPFAFATLLYFCPGKHADALRKDIKDFTKCQFGNVKANIFKRSERRDFFEAYIWLKNQTAAKNHNVSWADVNAYNFRPSRNPIKHLLSPSQMDGIFDAICTDKLRTGDLARFRFLPFLRGALKECICIESKPPLYLKIARDSVLDSHEAMNIWLAKNLIESNNYVDAQTYLAALDSSGVNDERSVKSIWKRFSKKDLDFLNTWTADHQRGVERGVERDIEPDSD